VKEKILLVGVGSGRDIASSILPLPYMIKNFKDAEYDVLGVLTPWAIHKFDNKFEGIVTNINNIKSFRKIFNAKYDISDVFFEHIIIPVFKNLGINITNLYLLSLHYLYTEILKKLKTLILNGKYNKILLVDVGGDILCPLKEKYELSTPIVDFVIRNLFIELLNNGYIDDIEIKVVTFGIGAVGDINFSPECIPKISEIISINEKDDGFKLYKLINFKIEQLTNARSYSFKIFVKFIEEKQKSQHITFKKLYRIGEKVYTINYEYFVDANIINKIFITDLKAISNLYIKDLSNLEFLYSYFTYVLNNGVAGTEIDLSTIPFPSLETNNSSCYLINVFSKANYRDKIQIIKDALEFWKNNDSIENAIINEEFTDLIDILNKKDTFNIKVDIIGKNFFLISKGR